MNLSSLVAGQPVRGSGTLRIRNPYHGKEVGTVALASRQDVETAVAAARAFDATPSRFQRCEILEKTRAALESLRDEFARIITSESGLALREARYEVGRTLDVLRFAAMEALRDDGQIFSADISPQGKARKIFTTREPLRCAAAITPFNHPLNQVAHKVAPAIAAGTPLVLKPSEKTPLAALRFAELLYASGLPAAMLSVLLGPTPEVAEPLVRHEEVEVLAFTGSVAVGKQIAASAGYKKLVLELGGNDPLIVLNDADLELAVTLAAEGCFRNSGQRCTAVKRVLVEDGVAPAFTARLADKAKEYICGDPFEEATRVGTVIDEAAAAYLESRAGGGRRHGGEGVGRWQPPRRALPADRRRQRPARLPHGHLRKLRPSRPDPGRARSRRCARGGELDRLRPQLWRRHHEPPERGQSHQDPALRHGEHQRRAGIPRRVQPVRRHQGQRTRREGRRYRSDQGLQLRKDL